MWTRQFWRDAAERGIKTTAMTAAATLGAAGLGLLESDWIGTASTAGMAGLLSVLYTIGQTGATGRTPSQAVVASTIVAEVVEGEVVAGPALAGVEDGDPVTVTGSPHAGKHERSSDTKAAATYHDGRCQR